MKLSILLSVLSAALFAPLAVMANVEHDHAPYIIDTSASPHAKLRPLPYDAVTWTQGFWADRWKQLDEVTLPEMWRLLADDKIGGVWSNFQIAAGQKQGKYYGTNWQDEWLYKWLEAAACVWRVTKEPWIKQRMDESVALIAAAQQPDGYLSTKIIVGKLPRYVTPNDHELYNMGHLITAAVIHHRMTGEENFLSVARKTADYLCATVGVKVDPFMAHNPSIIMGLSELYRETGEKRYLECAQLVVDRRGTKPKFPYTPIRPNAPEVPGSDLIQDRVPVRKATEMVGQNVFSTYLYAGASDVDAEIGDEALAGGLNRVWEDLTSRKMFVHGGISALARGTSHNAVVYESVGPAYDLPNTSGYNETCGQVGAFMWAARMLANDPDAHFADVMEKEMFNGFLGGVGLDGKSWFYRNSLRRFDKDYKPTGAESGPLTDMVARTQPGLRNVCCPSNLLRTFAEMSAYFYGRDDDGLWIHQFGGTRVVSEFDGEKLIVEQQTNYPWSGEVKIVVNAAPEKRAVKLHVRIPAWVRDPQLAINGQPVKLDAKSGSYATLSEKWKAGDVVTLTLPMPVQLVEGNPRVEQTRNQVAVTRGPMVYCLESTDLPNSTEVPDVYLTVASRFELSAGLPDTKLPLTADVVTLTTTGLEREAAKWDGLYRPLNATPLKPIPVKLVPYFTWANRGKSAMSVWLPVVWEEKL